MTWRASKSPLTVIQAVAGFPNEKATLFIISMVKKEMNSPQIFLCPVKRQGFTNSAEWELPIGCSSTTGGCAGGRCVAQCDMAQCGSAQPDHQPGMQYLPSRAVV